MKKFYILMTSLTLVFLLGSINVFGQNMWAVDFYGQTADEEWIRLADDASNTLDVTTNWTFECWINVDNTASGYDDVMYRDGVFSFQVNDANTPAGDFDVDFYNRDNSAQLKTTTQELNYGTWYHIAATFDGSTAKLYVDGNVVATDATASNWSLKSGDNLYIGARVSNNEFDGQIDEIRMSDIARTVSEMHTSSHEEEYISDANTIFLMNFNDKVSPPTYVSGASYTGIVKVDNISDDDFKNDEIASGKLLRPEYRTKASGNWNATASWEYDNTGAGNWVNASLTPNEYVDDITILNGHTITVAADVTIDQTTIASGGKVTVSSGHTLTVNNGDETDLTIDGTLRKEGTGSILYSGTLAFNDGGKFELAGTNKYIPVATWHDNSTCEITGAIEGDMTSTYHTDQEFGNFIWNCTGQTDNVFFSGALTDIDGDFTLINTNSNELRLTGTTGDDPILSVSGDVNIQGGILNLTSGDNNIYFVCHANFTQSGGTIKADGSGTGNLRFGPLAGSGYSGVLTHSGGTFSPEAIQVNSSYSLTVGSNVDLGSISTNILGTLIIPPTKSLSTIGDITCTGTLTNNAGNAGLVLKSTATEQGSLIHSTASVAATVERQITGYTGDNDGWHLLSSPVTNMAIAGSDFVPVAGTDDLFYWNEAQGVAGEWINYHVDGGGFGFTNFTNGQGYLCAYDVGGTKEFKGSLNVSNVTRGGFSIVNPNPWELVGNPFSSAIDWSAGTWTKTGLGANAKVYNEGGGNYLTETIIPPTQGFIVEVLNGTNSLTIPTDARVHNDQNWYKGAKDSENTLELKISGGDNSFYDITQIILNDDATLEFDDLFDGHKFFGAATAPQLYTVSPSNEILTDNHIPNLADEILIPTNFRVASESEYTITVELNTIEREGDIYLEDLATGIFTNLSTTDSYTFTASEEDAAERFMLHFSGTTGVDELSEGSDVNIYANAHTIYLNAEEAVTGDVMVYDMGGKLILSEQLENSNMHIISAESLSGVYLVRFIGNERVSTQKVIIQ